MLTEALDVSHCIGGSSSGLVGDQRKLAKVLPLVAAGNLDLLVPTILVCFSLQKTENGWVDPSVTAGHVPPHRWHTLTGHFIQLHHGEILSVASNGTV